jgi:hypothetical protein
MTEENHKEWNNDRNIARIHITGLDKHKEMLKIGRANLDHLYTSLVNAEIVDFQLARHFSLIHWNT